MLVYQKDGNVLAFGVFLESGLDSRYLSFGVYDKEVLLLLLGYMPDTSK